MTRRGVCLPAALAIFLLGCGHRTEQYILPDQLTDFSALYENNCAGCHGRDGHSGPARPLNDPLYLALIGKERLRDVIASGVPRTAMPGFAQNAGGTLTDQQVTILADQMEARWSRPRDFVGVALPTYSAELGDPQRGEAVFNGNCSICHGEKGVGGSLVNPAFLALVSDQSLRTTVIAGRSDRGMPNWRSHSPGHAMTPQEISDVVAWLSAHRAPSGNVAHTFANTTWRAHSCVPRRDSSRRLPELYHSQTNVEKVSTVRAPQYVTVISERGYLAKGGRSLP